jgi:multiple sugar transport system ATP-binding protein
LPAAAWPADRLGTLGSGALLGIRPEDLYETSPRPGDDSLLPLEATVAAVEPLGAETLLVLTLDGVEEEVIARCGRETRLRPGGRATIMLDSAAAHLFDAATTRAIARTPV